MRSAWNDVTVGGRWTNRSYGDKSFYRYATASFESVEDTELWQRLLNWACDLGIPKERLVNIGREAADVLIQVDAASVKRTGATTSFWTRHDYPEIDLDPPYQAPYDSKRQFVRVNCDTKTYRVLFGYDFTPDEAVTDAMTTGAERDEPLNAADDYARAIKDIACGKPIDLHAFSGIGGNTIRPKTPLNPDLGVVSEANPPEVLAAAKKLLSILPAASTARSAKLTVITKDTDTLSANPIVYSIRLEKDGRTQVHSTYRPNVTMDHEMAGMVELNSTLSLGSAAATSRFVTTALTLDSVSWEPNAEISFGSESRATGAPFKSRTTCTIGAPIASNTIHAALAGRSWPLRCDDTLKGVSEGYYIEELRYFLTTRRVPKDISATDYSIESLSVER
ncbi:surface-adhesin E family protein [Ralstonia insidiosa]|uniref:surface-adhesin E family protein n=1 Tax=Ralstonia insidiosa TaxID=190721 RepID=UPI001427B28D|nr:surface-adhesin E family protein [Ralstonia insidiosa]